MFVEFCLFLVSLSPPYFQAVSLLSGSLSVHGVLGVAKTVPNACPGSEREDFLGEKGFPWAFVFGLGDSCWADQEPLAAWSSLCLVVSGFAQ